MIIYKDFEFDMAHRLDGHKGLCRSIHGHLYKLTVGLNIDKLDKLGMCVDFKVIKEVVNKNIIDYVDHALWLKNSKANGDLIKTVKKNNMRLILTQYNPTAEYMALTFWHMLIKKLPLFTITVFETATSRITVNRVNYNTMKRVINDIEFSGEGE